MATGPFNRLCSRVTVTDGSVLDSDTVPVSERKPSSSKNYARLAVSMSAGSGGAGGGGACPILQGGPILSQYRPLFPMAVTQQFSPTLGGVEQVFPPQTLHDVGQQKVPVCNPCWHVGSAGDPSAASCAVFGLGPYAKSIAMTPPTPLVFTSTAPTNSVEPRLS